MKPVIDKNFFPGWVRKSVTFTIDDGNVPMDKKFVDIVKPAGILGTFNLNSNNLAYMTSDEYREFYSDYEIGNHVKYHPSVLHDGEAWEFCDEPFDRECADPDKLYLNPTVKGLGYFHPTKRNPNDHRGGPNGWRPIAVGVDDYVKFTEEGRAELEDLFGKEKVRGFIWPGGLQKNTELVSRLTAMGYESMRKAGSPIGAAYNFSLPRNRQNWGYNANHRNLLDVMEKYEALPDDGELKFFSLGVHSIDYENECKWEDLKAFAEKYGNRPDTYYYAAVGRIFDYEDAVKALLITDDGIVNPSNLDIYVKIDGKHVIIPANSKYKVY